MIDINEMLSKILYTHPDGTPYEEGPPDERDALTDYGDKHGK